MSNSLELSSDTLFHFTGLENVINILKEGFFRPRFCLEDMSLILPGEPTEDLQWAIPMVCFCDIPLSQSLNHRKIYGNYGIGLSKKEWGMRKKISPVLYAYQESAIIDNIMRVWNEVTKLSNGGKDDGDHVPIFYDCIQGMYCFTKAYEGKRWIQGDNRYSDKLVRFYDEREWRFVPMYENRHEYALTRNEFRDLLKQTDVNHELDHGNGGLSVLNFELSDIKCIIVTAEEEKDLIVKEMEQNTNQYSHDDIELLSSKISAIPVE